MKMDILNIVVVLSFVLQLFHFCYGDNLQWRSNANFGLANETSLDVKLESSTVSSLVQGGHVINFNITVSYRSRRYEDEVRNESHAELENAFESYCQYVEELRNKDIYIGGDNVSNCTNITIIVMSNFTCNSSDGVNCVYNLTANSTVFAGNFSSHNETGNVTSYTLIIKRVQHNITSLNCVNVTTPLVKIIPIIHPPSHFNITYESVEIELELPSEFNIESIEDLKLTNGFKNITLNCTQFVVNSSYSKHPSKPKITLQVQFSNISWNGTMMVTASVSERVVPRQLLNVTGNVIFAGITEPLWIGSYTVPGLWFKEMAMKTSNFAETPGNLLTDEEEVIIETSFVVPSVTTDIEVFIKSLVFAGSMPLKIISAHISSMQGNIKSSNLQFGSSIGSKIALEELVSLNPPALTLVKFNFGTTSNAPGFINSSIIMQITCKVDSIERNEGYIPNSHGNITSWLIYSTATGKENITCPQWVEVELGQPRIKHEMSFLKKSLSTKVEGGDEIECSFQFFNPAFATEAADVILNIVFASQGLKLINFTVAVCNITLDSSAPSHCLNNNASSLLNLITITNTTSSFQIQITNLTVGFGIFGKVVGIIIVSVPASEVLTNKVDIKYDRHRWESVRDQKTLTVYVKPILVSSAAIVSTSVGSTSPTSPTIGEKVTFIITVTIPVTTNEDFAVVVGGESISYENGILSNVGDNLVGRELTSGTELNVTSGNIPETGLTYSSVLVGRFGAVCNTGHSSVSNATMFTLQVSFLIKDIASTKNNIGLKVTTTVYHQPNRKYKSDKNFKIVEPVIIPSIVASPSKNVKQESEVIFTATIKHSSASKSDAFNLLVQLTVPYRNLTLTTITSKTGSIETVLGNLAPKSFNSPENINSTVIVYKNDVFQHGSATIEIKYKATTSPILPASVFITSPISIFFTSLPKSLNQSFARMYSSHSKTSLLTFRPDPFLTLTFNSETTGEFDSGDVLNYTLVVRNVGVGNVQPTAYSMMVAISLANTPFKDSTIVCNQGAVATFPTGTLYTLKVQKTLFFFNEQLKCNVTTTLNTVVPSQTIQLQANLVYHCLPTNLQHHYGSYSSRDEVDVKIKPLSMKLYSSGSVSQVLTGDILEFNTKITLPEVTTKLKVEYRIPTIASNARGRRSSVRQKRATQMNVLDPLLPQTTYSSGANLVLSPMVKSQTSNTYTIAFTSISNTPDNAESSQDVLIIKATFMVVNQPLILSGRNFEILSTVVFPGGSLSETVKFSVVGPLLKPLLQLAKSFQVIDISLDSPSGIFYVNVSHAPGSLYDAYDVNISDTTEGMNVIRDNEFPGIVISAPTNNKYDFNSNIPVIAVGQTIRFYYKSQFKVKTKSPRYLQTPASLTWRSPQLNSPVYGPNINSDACVARNDTIKERHEPLYGFLALAAFVGFVVGFILFIIVVCIFIKCCDKGRLVPYYRVFSGTTTYTVLQEENVDKLYVTKNNTSLLQTESVVYIIASDDPKKTEKQLENLDVQATKTLDRHLEGNRQKMFVSAFTRIIGNLRKKREISEEQSKMFATKLQGGLDDIAARNDREYKKRLADLKKKIQVKGEAEIKQLDERKMKEIEEAKKKLVGADKEKTKEVLSMIVSYYQSLEHDAQVLIQLQHDLEQEQIKKELSVNNRISSKELQSKLVKQLAVEAELSEEEAQQLIAEHFQAIAAAEKVHDDEKVRQIMALEMRLVERKALVQEMREQQQQQDELLSSMKEKYEKVLENLVNSSQMSEDEAAAYREKLLKDVDNYDMKLNKQRIRQEQNLHERLTLLKKQKLQEKEKEQQLELQKLEESRDNSEDPKDFIAQQELTQKHNEEMQDLERVLDKKATQDLKELRAQLAEEARREYKVKIEKQYKELIKKGVLEENLAELLDTHDKDVARLLEAQQAQQTKQRLVLEEKISKRRELLTEKMKAEQKEQEKIRKEEQKVLENMIDNQVVISEDEKEKILREHEKNMAELESSLTLNKLRQKQMLEQKLEQRRAMKLDKLQQKHENEHKRIKIENVDGTTEEIDLLKKQEMERLDLTRNDSRMENEVEQIRDEMLKARMEALEEHNDRLGALIAELQIQRANQIAEINKQQRALGQLQTGILDDLEEKGVLMDPETKEILQRHQDQTQQLEIVLKKQREQQEQALKDRLREKLKQKEVILIQEQKDEIGKYLDGMEANSGITRFRKAALKVRHKSQLDHARLQIEKEIEQSINEMKLQLEINRLKAIEKQSIQFIAALVKCGRIQGEELDSVLQVLFPTKTPEEIDELLTQIYGPDHTSSSSISLKSSKPSSLEMKVIAQISPLPTSRRKLSHFEQPEDLDDLPAPKAVSNLPPVVLQGSKGFNLQNTLQKQDSASKTNTVPTGRVRLAPIGK